MSDNDTSNTSKTDWDRVDRLQDDGIDTDEVPALDDAFFDRAKLRLPSDRVPVLLEVDPDVLQWFQSQGGEYQHRIAAALRLYVEAHRQAG